MAAIPHLRKACLACLIVVSLLGCRSTPPEIPENLDPGEIFQLAQEAVVERNDYRTALHYYETFLERFGEDLKLTVEAEYEIAFIYYKLGDTDLAKEKFSEILDKYGDDDAQLLPRWPLILTEKVLAKINEPGSIAEE